MPTPAEAAQELLTRRKARRGLLDFCQYVMPSYEAATHLVLLCGKLEAVERGEIKNLMIFMPPRSGKSQTASINFPAWYLGKHPQGQIIGCSYSEGLAYGFSTAVRNTISSTRYQMLWPYKLDTSGAIRWQLANKENQRASYIAAGVGGGILGEGADILCIDDPVKNAEEAESANRKDAIWQWYITTALTRMQPGGSKILIMSRWATDDLAGRLLNLASQSKDADQWEVLHLKAITDGKALWPEHYPLEVLERIRAGQVDDPSQPGAGSRAFASLYQGEPTVAGGNIIKREWWRFCSVAPVFSRIIQTWDTAFKKEQSNDFSVCETWGQTDTGYYLLDVWRQRAEFPDLKRAAKTVYDAHKPSAIYVEDAASGQSLIQELKRDTRLPVIAVKVDKDKVTRANAVAPLIESGRVFLPERAPWLHAFIEECSEFPSGEHDDQCFAAGTQVATLWGDKPIEDIQPGEYVLTPFGLRKVVASGKTGIKKVVHRGTLCGTGSHPVFSYDGWVPLDALTMALRSDKLSLGGLIRWKYRKLLSSMAFPTDLWEGRDAIISVSQAPMKGENVLRDFTWRFGNFIIGRQFQKATSFITAMAILSITISAIWSVYRASCTLRDIQSKSGNRCFPTWQISAHWQRNGMVQPRAEHGIGNMPVLSTRHNFIPVSNAIRNSLQSVKRSFVRIFAAIGLGMHMGIMSLQPDASYVGMPLLLTAPFIPAEQPRHAAELVEGVSGEFAEVYNLTVGKTHVYYAHGILVANCDALTMALSQLSRGADSRIWL